MLQFRSTQSIEDSCPQSMGRKNIMKGSHKHYQRRDNFGNDWLLSCQKASSQTLMQILNLRFGIAINYQFQKPKKNTPLVRNELIEFISKFQVVFETHAIFCVWTYIVLRIRLVRLEGSWETCFGQSFICRSKVFMVSLFVSHIPPVIDYGSCLWNIGY